jgi:hypothetical protein
MIFPVRYHAREALVPEVWYRKQVEYLNTCFKLTHVHMLKLHSKLDTQNQVGLDKFEEALVPVDYKLKALGAEIIVESSCSCPQLHMKLKLGYDRPFADWERKMRADSAFVSMFEYACSGIPLLFGEKQTYWPIHERLLYNDC